MGRRNLDSCMDKAKLIGKVVSVYEDLPFHTSGKFLGLTITSARKKPSDQKDYITVLVNKQKIGSIKEGSFVKVFGSLQTKTEDRHLYIYIYASDITEIDDAGVEEADEVEFEGYLCKPPILRKTPLTNREICDFVLAVNERGYSYYIPCICWGSVAKRMATSSVGDKLYVAGRLQSREYVKEEKSFTVNEVSAFYIRDSFIETED